MSEIEPYPEQRAGETAQVIARAALGSIPVVGPAAAELFGGTVAPILQRRQIEWLNGVAEKLSELGALSGHWAIANLADNDAFASAVATAVGAARRTSNPEKLQALRNAVLNSVGPGAEDETVQAVLLAYAVELTPWHLSIPAVGADPGAWFDRHPQLARPQFALSSNHQQMLDAALPELRGRQDFYHPLLHDLDVRGLGTMGSGMMTADAAWSGWASPLGQRLILYVSDPQV